jgi:hypothetical protein
VLKEDVPAKFGNGQVPSVSSLTGAGTTNGPTSEVHADLLTNLGNDR